MTLVAVLCCAILARVECDSTVLRWCWIAFMVVFMVRGVPAQ